MAANCCRRRHHYPSRSRQTALPLLFCPQVRRRASDRLPVDDVELPPIGTDVDFSEIEAHILAASSLRCMRSWRSLRSGHPKSRTFIDSEQLDTETKRISVWSMDPVYLTLYESDFFLFVVNRCARTGLISKLPNKRNHYHPLIFSENIECDFAEIRKVKIPRYCWNFLEHDFYLAALFHMRMTAVQNKAIAEAEKVRKLLVEKIRKERKHKKHHKQLQKDPSIKVEDDDGGGGGGKEKSAKKKHKKSKK